MICCLSITPPIRVYRYLATSLVWLLLVLTLPSALFAAEQPVFEIKEASFKLDDRLLMLDSEFAINLPAYINSAVDQGFAVPLMFQVEILVLKKYWLDEKVISLKQQYQLHFLPMLNTYVVFDVNADQRLYFNSRPEAVQYLRTISNYPMLDINNLVPGPDYYARLRIGIDTDELPLPLKSSSLWDNDWNLKSDWYEWQINRPES